VVKKTYIEPINMPYWMNNIDKLKSIKKILEKLVPLIIFIIIKGKKYVMEDILEYCEPGKNMFPGYPARNRL